MDTAADPNADGSETDGTIRSDVNQRARYAGIGLLLGGFVGPVLLAVRGVGNIDRGVGLALIILAATSAVGLFGIGLHKVFGNAGLIGLAVVSIIASIFIQPFVPDYWRLHQIVSALDIEKSDEALVVPGTADTARTTQLKGQDRAPEEVDDTNHLEQATSVVLFQTAYKNATLAYEAHKLGADRSARDLIGGTLAVLEAVDAGVAISVVSGIEAGGLTVQAEEISPELTTYRILADEVLIGTANGKSL